MTIVDPTALETLCNYWVRLVDGTQDESEFSFAAAAASAALEASPPEIEEMRDLDAFMFGVDFCLRIVAAVLADPLGDPVPAIERSIAWAKKQEHANRLSARNERRMVQQRGKSKVAVLAQN